MASDISKTAKITKRWYYPPAHRLNVNVLLSNITKDGPRDCLNLMWIFRQYVCSRKRHGRWREYSRFRPVSNCSIGGSIVLKTLSRLKPDKSPGPDNMHPMLLRETAHCITKPLTWIFQKSVQEGIVPDDWKRANITPIFNKRSK